MSSKKQEDGESLDLLHGARAIAKFTRLEQRSVYHHFEQGHFRDSVWNFGKHLIADKTKLREVFRVSA